jgi:hypothetical protein
MLEFLPGRPTGYAVDLQVVLGLKLSDLTNGGPREVAVTLKPVAARSRWSVVTAFPVLPSIRV